MGDENIVSAASYSAGEPIEATPYEAASIETPTASSPSSAFPPPLSGNNTSVFAPSSAGPDSKANSEAVKMAAGDNLEKDGKQQEHSRHQTFRNHLNKATLILFWTVVSCLIVGILIYVWHLLTPEAAHFLTEAQFSKLQTLLAAALISSSLRGYVDQRMK